jgi:type IV secretion system protein VirD4
MRTKWLGDIEGTFDYHIVKKGEAGYGQYGTSDYLSYEELRKHMVLTDIKKPKGTILCRVRGRNSLVCFPRKMSDWNQAVAVIGPPGSHKSRGLIYPNILERIRYGESFVVSDPAGDIYAKTSRYARDAGFDVKIFNTKDLKISDGWDVIGEIRKSDNPGDAAVLFTDTIIANTTIDKAMVNEAWDKAERSLMSAIALYVATSEFVPDECRNIRYFYTLVLMANEEKPNAYKDENPYVVDALIEKHPINSQIRSLYKSFQAEKRLRGNVIWGIASRLQILANPDITEALSTPNIDLTAPGERPCAYYVICSTRRTSNKILLSLFFSYLIMSLTERGERGGADTRLPVSVRLLLDEFPSLGHIADFDLVLANARKYRIEIMIITQAIGYIKEMYPRNLWSAIMAVFSSILVLGVGTGDSDTAEYVSGQCGKCTAMAEQVRHQRPHLFRVFFVHLEEMVSKMLYQRDLIMPDEVARKCFDGGCLLLVNGLHPYLGTKMDYSLMAEAKFLDDPNNQTHINQHVPERLSKIGLPRELIGHKVHIPQAPEKVDGYEKMDAQAASGEFNPEIGREKFAQDTGLGGRGTLVKGSRYTSEVQQATKNIFDTLSAKTTEQNT